jgi:hypothetical protein
MHIGKPPEPIASDASERRAHTGFVKPLAAYPVIAALMVIAHGVGATYGISLFGQPAASLLSVAEP